MAIFGLGKKTDTLVYCAALVDGIPCGKPAEQQQKLTWHWADGPTLVLDIPLCQKHQETFATGMCGREDWDMYPKDAPSNQLPPTVEHPSDFRAAQRRQNTEA